MENKYYNHYVKLEIKFGEGKGIFKELLSQMLFESCEASIEQKRSGRKPDSKEALLLTGEISKKE